MNVYDAELHKYYVDGVEKPSVTEVAKPISFESLNAIEKHVLERARERGTRLHEIFQEYMLLDEIDLEDIAPEYVPYVNQFILWRKTYRPKTIYTEKILFSDEFCGTLDLLCEIGGKTIIVDYKNTSKANKKSLSVQLEGYYRLAALYGIKVDDCYYLQIKKDSFVFKPVLRDPEWFDILLNHNKKMKEKYHGK